MTSPAQGSPAGVGARHPMMRALALSRHPAVRFLALGALLFIVDRMASEAPSRLGAGPPQIVELPAVELAELREDWRSRTGEWPTGEEERGLIEGWFADEVLFREALAHGLDRNDLIVRRRLISKMQFLVEDPTVSHAELYRRALELGLDRHDPIVRQRLIQRMQMLIADGRETHELSEEELVSFYESHREQFREPERMRLSQIFLSSELRGSALESDARDLLAHLLQDGSTALDAAALEAAAFEAESLGDPFFAPPVLPISSPQDLQRYFGPELPRHLAECPLETWCGPLTSPYGLHLVRVEQKWPATVASLEEVRHEVHQAAQLEKRRQHLAEMRRQLERRYALRIEEAKSPSLITSLEAAS